MCVPATFFVLFFSLRQWIVVVYYIVRTKGKQPNESRSLVGSYKMISSCRSRSWISRAQTLNITAPFSHRFRIPSLSISLSLSVSFSSSLTRSLTPSLMRSHIFPHSICAIYFSQQEIFPLWLCVRAYTYTISLSLSSISFWLSVDRCIRALNMCAPVFVCIHDTCTVLFHLRILSLVFISFSILENLRTIQTLARQYLISICFSFCAFFHHVEAWLSTHTLYAQVCIQSE